MYVAQNYYRGTYKKPQWGLEQNSPVGGFGSKLEQTAPYLGYAAGFAKTIYDNWNIIRPVVAGVAALA